MVRGLLLMHESHTATEILEDLYEDAPCGHISLLADGKIVRVNRTLLDWLGYSAEELTLGRYFPTLLTVPSALLYESYCVPLLRMRGSVGEVALDFLCRDGRHLPVLLSADAKRDLSGTPYLLRLAIFSSPKRREYELELRLARAQAEDITEQLRVQRAITERKVHEQEALLQAVARMARGDLETPIVSEPEGGPSSGLSDLAHGLDRMRREVLTQMRDLKERNGEILRLNAELLHQIEQRSRLLLDSMQSALSNNSPAAQDEDGGEVRSILPRGTLLAKRYRVEAILGRGAMGTVYEVERLSDGRRLAAKVLSSRPDYRSMARFAREALLLTRLQHPNLIAIVDLDITSERTAYLIMELVDGKSLAELDTLYGDHGFMLPVLRQIADALTTVHGAGVVHRDLKPANVLISISEDGSQVTARLADFGISRLFDGDPSSPSSAPPIPPGITAGSLAARSGWPVETLDDPSQLGDASTEVPASEVKGYAPTLDVRPRPGDGVPALEALLGARSRRHATSSSEESPQSQPGDELTQAGALVGTLLYMAPELLAGASLAQPSSDIFSFGLMAYEILTGTLPFEEPPLILAARDRGRLRFTPLDEMCPTLSPSLASLLERCLTVNPAGRPTAAELSAALGGFRPPLEGT